MKISKNKLLIYILTFIIVYQDSLISITHLGFLDHIDELFILFFVARAIFYLAKRSNISSLTTKIFILLSLFWVVGVVSCLIHSSYRFSSLLMASILMVKIYLLIMSLIIHPIKEKTYYHFVDALLFAGKITAVTGIVNFIAPSLWTKLIPFAYDYTRQGLPSVMGLFIHAGQYGWFMLFISILYYSKYRTNKEKRSLYLFIVYACLACLSMKVKVVLGIATILLFDSFVLQKKRIDAKKIIIPFIGVGFVIFFFGGLISETYQMYFTDSGGSARYAFLVGSLSIIKDFFPLGVGFSKFGTYYAQVNYSEWYYAYGLNTVWGLKPGNIFFGMDTFWPAIMGETGVLGTIIYVVLLATIMKALYRNYKTDVSVNGKSCSFIALSSLLVFVQALVESTGEQIFNSSPQNIVIGIMVGFALSKKLRNGIKIYD
ncbi:O-antigen ligase family protein [Anaerobium acetethylicum]|uniref:O-Antigen ligase n=1 Tax=Anaerobium acetethylicum TaxID=1619234 RepID=A0A1D3TRA3_9FIRM|nr:hypothetical protein [Anaerobium acetethylicum]SCP96231.1 hypothetical protein SAMN05421730_100430 [Anaerobium acetethylicum]